MRRRDVEARVGTQCGDDAKLEAGKRADQLLAEGDMDGQRVWLRIIRAIEELQRHERRDGEAVN